MRGMENPYCMKDKGNRHNGSRHVCQREKLAEYTVVCPRCHLRQMAMTTVVNTVGTLCHRCSPALMYVE
jgi:hypothetical protein